MSDPSSASIQAAGAMLSNAKLAELRAELHSLVADLKNVIADLKTDIQLLDSKLAKVQTESSNLAEASARAAFNAALKANATIINEVSKQLANHAGVALQGLSDRVHALEQERT